MIIEKEQCSNLYSHLKLVGFYVHSVFFIAFNTLEGLRKLNIMIFVLLQTKNKNIKKKKKNQNLTCMCWIWRVFSKFILL